MELSTGISSDSLRVPLNSKNRMDDGNLIQIQLNRLWIEHSVISFLKLLAIDTPTFHTFFRFYKSWKIRTLIVNRICDRYNTFASLVSMNMVSRTLILFDSSLLIDLTSRKGIEIVSFTLLVNIICVSEN